MVRLATNGIYSKIRHPIYSGFIFVNFGLSLLFFNYAMFILSVIFVLLWYIVSVYEERILIDKFGEEYLNYKEKVKWKFIPKIF